MNDLKRICKSLEKGRRECGNYCCVGDNYLCAKYAVNQYISKESSYQDKNRLLLLKSECKDSSFVEPYNLLVCIISMAICVITLIFNMMEKLLENDYVVFFHFCVVLLSAMSIYCIILILSLIRGTAIVKWKPFILTAIEEIEKEIK